jgi:hypothetical protein
MPDAVLLVRTSPGEMKLKLKKQTTHTRSLPSLLPSLS